MTTRATRWDLAWYKGATYDLTVPIPPASTRDGAVNCPAPTLANTSCRSLQPSGRSNPRWFGSTNGFGCHAISHSNTCVAIGQLLLRGHHDDIAWRNGDENQCCG